MSRESAIRIAQTIKDYWSARGFEVATRVVFDETAGHIVETDLVDGLPPAATGDELIRREKQRRLDAFAKRARPL